jgi:heme A synthase
LLAVGATFLLLAVGQMVTSFRAGMADPIWPTEPWYLASNFKLDLGYLIEHSHRIIGFSVGIIVTVLAIGLLRGECCTTRRWLGLVGLVVLLGGYGEFHRGLIAQRDVAAAQVKVPVPGAATAGIGLALALGATLSGWAACSRGAAVRTLGVVALVAVMIQGLLGGFRVKLNELVGTDLATVHGVFAQVVFGLLVSLAVLTARPVNAAPISREVRTGSVVLAVLVFVQIVWGAMVRHDPTALTQKLHFLTAFAATGVAVWLLVGIFADPAAKSRVKIGAHLLSGLLLLQLYLGVEAWMEKFGQGMLPELVPITKENAAIRTLHALVGSALFATSLALAVRLRQTKHAAVSGDETADTTSAEAGTLQPMLTTAGASHPGATP